MNIENIPQVGSKWQFHDKPCQVTATHKRGRGYQVVVEKEGFPPGLGFIVRLRDFLKDAKPL